MEEAMRLRDSGHTVEEIKGARFAEIKIRIRDWADEFAVESPNQLRGMLSDDTLSLGKHNLPKNDILISLLLLRCRILPHRSRT